MLKVHVIGHVGREPSTQKSKDGDVIRFSVASNYKEETEWLSCSAYGRIGERALDLKKGQQVYVEGRLTSSLWADKKGDNRFSMNVNVSELWLCGQRNAEEQTAVSSEAPYFAADDDLPF